MNTQVAELIRNVTAVNDLGGPVFHTLHGITNHFPIPYSSLDVFYDRYCHLANEDEDNDSMDGKSSKYKLCIAEEVDKVCPIIVHLILKFDDESKEDDYYEDSFYRSIIFSYQKAITELIKVNDHMSEYIATVEESPAYREGNIICKHLKIQFPYCRLPIEFQNTILKEKAIKNLRSGRTIEHINFQPVGDWPDIIQNVKKIVPMYRSSSQPNAPRMRFTATYGYIQGEDIVKNWQDDEYEKGKVDHPLSLEDVFDVQNFSMIFNSTINRDFIKKDVDIHYWLPLFLSVHFWYGVSHQKTAVSKDEESKSVINHSSDITSDNEADMVVNLLPLLSKDRFIEEHYWLDIGRALYNIFNGQEEGLNLWSEYSSKVKVPGRDHRACAFNWRQVRNSFLTVKTIAWYARIDSPEGYKKWHKGWMSKALETAIDKITNLNVAEVIYRKFWLDYMCTNISKGKWAYFSGHRLVKLDAAHKLIKDITGTFISLLDQMDLELAQVKIECKDKSERKRIDVVKDQISTLTTKLGSDAFLNAVIRMCKVKFHVEDYDSKIDKGGMKSAWNNCVIEICGGKAYPRPGKPEDFITKCTFTTYHSNFSWNHSLVVEVMDWLNKVYPDKKLLHHALKVFASFLRGKNAEKLFQIWSGAGDNSKSMIIKAIQLVLGMYAIDLPVSMLAGGSNVKTFSSSGPTPELAQANGAFLGVMCEPDDNTEIKGGAMKRLTGGDRFFARACNDDGGSIDMLLKVIYICNDIPSLTQIDRATIARLIIIPHLSTWVDNPPEDPEEQYRQRLFKKDPFFEERLPDLSEALAWIMVEYFPIYMEEGLNPPEIVKQYTEKYWEENDLYVCFIGERISQAYKEVKQLDGTIKSEVNIDACVTATDLYGAFKTWYKENFPGAIIPKMPTFKSQLSQKNRLGPHTKSKWYGIRLNVPVSLLDAHV